MSYSYFSRNGEILPIDDATIPLSNVEYSYGFGVYESIRIANGTVYFLPEHCHRLMKSAEVISLEHNFTAEFVAQSISSLLAKNAAETCNIKVLLIGGRSAQAATLYILCLNPLFPNRKLYRNGVTAITYEYERDFPQAKTLNMLPSYLAYRQARAAGAYDALLINRDGNIIEGTRTNFFALKDRTIFTPPESVVLPGVTRHHVLEVARQNNYQLIEQQIPLTSLQEYDDFFLTSTSSKIMPLHSIDAQVIGVPGDELLNLMNLFDKYIDKISR